ncbi:MAG: 5-(carboxyamino)imidazole ribonucleotide mutase [Candidatus Omnitrophica bacterium]|nr:5-(carboxyamino)imidazole ribonucleotide mutase [Candidatus Omnitrophota bacterium]
MKKPLVGIIMGSQSDLKIMGSAAVFLEELGIPCEVSVISAHRAPQRTFDYAQKAVSRGLKVIIAGAGGAAHLPGVVAALTVLPVIGVPIRSSNSIEGLDSLLSIVQMPEGVPVATMATNGAKNAGILAAQIIATSDKVLTQKLVAFKKTLEDKVDASANLVKAKGYRALMAQ